MEHSILSKKNNAHLIQGLTGKVDSIDRFGITKTVLIPSGGHVELYYFAVIAKTLRDGIDTYHVIPDPNDTYIDHIDCWGKYLSPTKVIIREVPILSLIHI